MYFENKNNNNNYWYVWYDRLAFTLILDVSVMVKIWKSTHTIRIDGKLCCNRNLCPGRTSAVRVEILDPRSMARIIGLPKRWPISGFFNFLSFLLLFQNVFPEHKMLDSIWVRRFSDINFLYTMPTMLINYSAFCYRISCISKIRITTMTIETGCHWQRVAGFTSRYSAAAWFYKLSSACQCPHKCCLQLLVKSNEMNIYIHII